MEAIYKVNFESGGYDYEKYYTAKALTAQSFIQDADEFCTCCENADFGEEYKDFAEVIREAKKGGKWNVECYYYDENDDFEVWSFDIEKISIINS